MQKVENVILEEVISEYEEIGKMPIGEDVHTKAVRSANEMVDRLNDAKKIAIEQRKLDIEEEKLEVERARIENDKKGRVAGYIINGILIFGSALINLYGYADSKKFEKEGNMHTTNMGRQSERNLLSFFDKIKLK